MGWKAAHKMHWIVDFDARIAAAGYQGTEPRKMGEGGSREVGTQTKHRRRVNLMAEPKNIKRGKGGLWLLKIMYDEKLG